MPATRPAPRLSAADLRHCLSLGTQPALLTTDDDTALIVGFQFDRMVAYLRDECGVTLRRLENALGAVSLPSCARRQLLAAWGA